MDLLTLAFCCGMATLSVTVDNVEEATGKLWIGIYESEDDFLDRDKARLVYVPVTHPGRQQIRIEGLTVGKSYALAVFHDTNDNGELDTNVLGLPAEPYVLSRPLRSWFRKPRFEEMSFVFDPTLALPPLRLH